MVEASGRNADEYDRIYRSSSYDIASVYDHIIRIRQRYLADVGGALLDHGFGNGVLSVYFQREGFEVHGVEVSSEAHARMIERAGRSGLDPGRFHLVRPDQPRLPFDDGTFSAIVSNQVLYFLPSREAIDAAVCDFRRVLRRGGKLACTIMAENNHYFTSYGVPPVPDSGMVEVRVRGRIERDFRLYRFRNEADVRCTFENAGLSIDDLGYFDFRLLDVTCAKHYIVLAHKP